jgi:hypothetical protein
VARGYDQNEVNRLNAIFTQITGGVPDSYSGYAPQNEPDTSDEEEEYAVSTEAPARLTDIPTSSTDVSRPRTVAAGYDKSRQTMTVVFRDGTIYNYYDVSPDEWLGFHNAISKGKAGLNRANSKQAQDGIFIGKNRGLADVSNVDPEVMAQIYRVARTSQVKFAYSGNVGKYKGTVPKAARAKAQLSPRSATSKSLGKNTSKGGKNPHK